jgi:alanyl-tRNA synthetase
MGFPVDLTVIMEEKGFCVDEEAFQKEMAQWLCGGPEDQVP